MTRAGEKKLIIAIIVTGALVLAVMTMIFYFSSCDGEQSSAQSGSITEAFIRIFIPGFRSKSAAERAEITEKMTFLIRKAGHFSEFMLLGIFSSAFIILIKKKIYISFIFCGLYAVSDEIHQIYTDGRSPSATDVLIDVAGAAFGICIVCLIVFLKRKAGKNNAKSARA